MNKRGEKLIKNNSGQVWIETVLYTLIGLAMIALVLSYAIPSIEESRDEAILEQSTLMLEEINTKILSTNVPGSQNLMSITIKKGELVFDGTNGADTVTFTMESAAKGGEEGINFAIGDVNTSTTVKNDINIVDLFINYTGRYNLTINGEDKIKTLTQASTPYSILIINNGKGDSDLTQIELSIQ